jgi:hypothetical protein
MDPPAAAEQARVMPTFHLAHRHAPGECRIAYAAWKGIDSPLRHRRTVGSCAEGGHALWWVVRSPDADAALALLPRYIAERTVATEVSEVEIP